MCFPFFHNYSAWSEVVDSTTCFVKVQYRKCLSCNKVVMRKIYTKDTNYSTTTANQINKALANIDAEEPNIRTSIKINNDPTWVVSKPGIGTQTRNDT